MGVMLPMKASYSAVLKSLNRPKKSLQARHAEASIFQRQVEHQLEMQQGLNKNALKDSGSQEVIRIHLDQDDIKINEQPEMQNVLTELLEKEGEDYFKCGSHMTRGSLPDTVQTKLMKKIAEAHMIDDQSAAVIDTERFEFNPMQEVEEILDQPSEQSHQENREADKHIDMSHFTFQ